MGRVNLQSAFVLHSRNYSDSSLIAELFSKEFGRVSVLAKGYRSQKKRSQSLQPFSELLVSWSGRGELKTLTGLENSPILGAFVGVRLYAGLYVNELLMRLLQKSDPHPEIYQYYQQLLGELSCAQEIEPSLRSFEFCLLAELGYALDCQHESQTGGEILPNHIYRYIPDQGFYPVADSGDLKTEYFVGEDLLLIAERNYKALSTKRAAKRLIRLAMAPHLGSKPLKSRELFLHSKN